MTLRRKTRFGVGLTFVCLLLALYATARVIVLSGFQQTEEQATRRDVDRVLSSFADESANLAGAARDWATWDDTYRFIVDNNAGYRSSNLDPDSSYVNNRISLMVYVDNAGGVVFAKAYDLAAGKFVSVPPDLGGYLRPNSLLLRHPALDSAATGLLALNEGAFIVSAQPILTSLHSGPIRGTLLFGRAVSAQEIDLLAQQTHLALSAYRPGASGLPADVQAALTALSPADPVPVTPLSGTTVAGYGLIRDVAGQPALLVRVVQPREIYARGEQTVVYFLAAIIGVCLIWGLLTCWVLERGVLARLSRLSKVMDRLGGAGDLGARVPVAGRDELAHLATDINAMLAALERADQERQALEDRARAQLEAELAERRRLETELAYRAFHDSLTGLPNRARFMGQLEEAMVRARATGRGLAVLFTDLDDFKVVNDTLGHRAGDDLLIAVAARLQACARRDDIAARLGGDEFTVLLQDLSDPAEGTRVAERVRAQLLVPFRLDDHEVYVSASVGIAFRGPEDDQPDDLLRNADLAMYAAKRQGKGGYAVFVPAPALSGVARA